MKIEPENPQDIADIIAAEFRTFGGERVTMGNPISHALKDEPASFAAVSTFSCLCGKRRSHRTGCRKRFGRRLFFGLRQSITLLVSPFWKIGERCCRNCCGRME